MGKTTDKNLLKALTKAYTARAKLFHNGVKAAKLDLLIAEIDGIDGSKLDWKRRGLGNSETAMARVEETGAELHQVFAHPDVIIKRPHLIGYYRNVVTISKKGISQLLFNTDAFEARRRTEIDKGKAELLCKTFNTILSGVIEGIADYKISLSRKAILAEIGSELQGTWANTIGKNAAKEVREILHDHVTSESFLKVESASELQLTNGWRITFAAEPDVAFVDGRGVKRIAIEIKGSLDTAGAQTRYGEAKKTFQKQLRSNPRCHTVYLASCFTDAVIDQIKADGQVRDWFNLTSILYDGNERKSFLGKLFHIVRGPQ